MPRAPTRTRIHSHSPKFQSPTTIQVLAWAAWDALMASASDRIALLSMPKLCGLQTVMQRPLAVRNSVASIRPGTNSALTKPLVQHDRRIQVMTPPASLVALGDQAAMCDWDTRSANSAIDIAVPWTS